MYVRVGEVFFRVVAALCGWVILSTHMLLVLLIPRAVMLEDGQLWLGTLVFGIVCIGAAIVVGLGRPWGEILRWVTIPAALMLPFAVWATLPYLAETTFGGLAATAVHAGLTSGPDAAGPERAWAPVQLTALGITAVQIVRTWRSPGAQTNDPSL
jgi:hypothetical protein